MEFVLGAGRRPGYRLAPQCQEFLHAESGKEVAVLAEGIERVEEVPVPCRHDNRPEIFGYGDHLGDHALVKWEEGLRSALGLNRTVECPKETRVEVDAVLLVHDDVV